MTATICTLFEGDYHYGVGALVNSLYRHGFRGTIWAGYRGPLPPWARPVTGAAEYAVAPGCAIRFVPLDTPWHFTNYKPRFMLRVLDDCPDATGVAYFDPDITIKCGWAFYEDWISAGGVALCEDVNSPMPARHPMKLAWQRWAAHHGLGVFEMHDRYFNGGFVGVARSASKFLETWYQVITLVGQDNGGLHRPAGDGPSHLFDTPDQDALNITTLCCDVPLSPLGREGMDFQPGGYTMSHAIGSPKPWRKRFIRKALCGRRPSLADKNYWRYIDGPIRLYPKAHLLRKRAALQCASAIGRYLG